jgi:hypothetical protein
MMAVDAVSVGVDVDAEYDRLFGGGRRKPIGVV